MILIILQEHSVISNCKLSGKSVFRLRQTSATHPIIMMNFGVKVTAISYSSYIIDFSLHLLAYLIFPSN